MAQPAPAPASVHLLPPFGYIDSTGVRVFDPYHIERQYNLPRRSHSPYDMNSKIMLAAIVSLSLVSAVVILLHLYARYVLRRQYRRTVLITTDGGATTIPRKTGLDPTVITSLPVSAYRQGLSNDTVECAVCLSLVEEDEMVRSLPNCGHGFHAECVDKWLSCHTTCPICRTDAEPPVTINIEPEPREGPAVAADAKVVPTEAAASSSRMGSFKRMLSRERSSRRMQIQIREDVERQ